MGVPKRPKKSLISSNSQVRNSQISNPRDSNSQNSSSQLPNSSTPRRYALSNRISNSSMDSGYSPENMISHRRSFTRRDHSGLCPPAPSSGARMENPQISQHRTLV